MHRHPASLIAPDQRDRYLREGDIIFSAIPNPLYRRIAEATGSPTSHVGILFRNPDGRWVVAESGVPCVRYVSLDNFVARSHRGWHVVRRLRLAPEDRHIRALRSECDRHLGKLYHTGFRYESKRMFCSKFVYEAYRNAMGVEIGTLETFAELLSRRPATALNFWRLWFFGRIPWARLTVTPASQLESPLLETVWTTGQNPASVDDTTRRPRRSAPSPRRTAGWRFGVESRIFALAAQIPNPGCRS